MPSWKGLGDLSGICGLGEVREVVFDFLVTDGNHDACLGAGCLDVVGQGAQQKIVLSFNFGYCCLADTENARQLELSHVGCGADHGQVHADCRTLRMVADSAS